MQKESVSSESLATFLSPVDGTLKGWYSERIPSKSHHNNINNSINNTTTSSRRHISASTFTPFYSGRTLPSKWEDAERWICSTSPVGHVKTASSSYHNNYQRRPKSKSGPLGPVGYAGSSQCFLNFSPAVVLDGGVGNGFVVGGSPFSTGVIGVDRVGLNFNDGVRRAVGGGVDRSVSVPGWSDLATEHSEESSQDEKLDGGKDGESVVSRVISRRDMATQISPEGSNHSSPKERMSFSPSTPSRISGVDQKDETSEFEVRDVQVDKRATVVRQSRRHGKRTTKKKSPDPLSLGRNDTDGNASSWEVSAAVDDSKLDREEAKIAAWENLQKAKAEAAIRELEVKLEEKRSASMDKILKKLKVAERKAQEMRSSLSVDQDHHVSRKSRKKFSLSKNIRMGFLGGCFAGHAP